MLSNLSFDHKNKKAFYYFLLSLLFILLLYLRTNHFVLYFESMDYKNFTKTWYTTLQKNGAESFKNLFYNYSPLYLYILYFTSLIFPAIPPVAAIKIPSIAGDFICAYAAYKITRSKYKDRPLFPILTASTVLCSPPIVANSALWGQCDSIYTACVLFAFYFITTKNYIRAFAILGLAVSFKLQAIFIFPFIILITIRNEIPLRLLLIIPLTYIITIAPVFLYSKYSFFYLIGIYIRQINQYHFISKNIPNLYALFPLRYHLISHFFTIKFYGELLTLLITVFYVWFFMRYSYNHISEYICVAYISVLMTPYFLPCMHERYLYTADIFSIIWAAYFPEYIFISLCVVLISFLTYLPFLFDIKLSFESSALFFLCVLYFLVLHGIKTLSKQNLSVNEHL